MADAPNNGTPDDAGIPTDTTQLGDAAKSIGKAIDWATGGTNSTNNFAPADQQEPGLKSPVIDPVAIAGGMLAAPVAGAIVDAAGPAMEQVVGNEAGAIGKDIFNQDTQLVKAPANAVEDLVNTQPMPVQNAQSVAEKIAFIRAAKAAAKTKGAAMAAGGQATLDPAGQAAFDNLATPAAIPTAAAAPQAAPDTTPVDVVDPSGAIGSIPAHQLDSALASGYQRATPEQLQAHDHIASLAPYTTPGQELLTGLEGVAKGLAGPLATGAERLLSVAGVPGITPEEQEKRAEANPGIHYSTEIGALVAPAIASFGLSAAGRAGLEGAAAAAQVAGKIDAFTQAGLLSKLGAGAASWAGLGAEGAGYASRVAAGALKGSIDFGTLQVGDEASRLINGDPNQTAATALTDIGGAAVLGTGAGAFGAGVASPLWKLAFGEKVGAGLSKAKRALNPDPVITPTAPNAAAPISEVPSGAAPSEPAPSVDSPVLGQEPPKSFEDMAQKVQDARADGQTFDLPQKQALLDATKNVPMEWPVHPLQIESLSDQGTRDAYLTLRETPGADGDVPRGYESGQRQELIGKTDDAIKALTPATVTSDAVKSGRRAGEMFATQYQAEQAQLKPVFDSFRAATSDSGADHLPGVLEGFNKAVPGVSKAVDVVDGAVTLKPYNTSWGLDKATYNAVKEAVNGLQEGGGGFSELANVRGALDQNVDVTAQGRAPGQIRALKASMMDYIQNLVDKTIPEAKVRDIYKRWAVNEQERGVIEGVFGSSVGNPEFGAISKVKPETVVDNIFKNTATVNAAKRILPPEQFNELLASHLAEQRALATKDGVFSSQKFGTYLSKNQDALGQAFESKPMSAKPGVEPAENPVSPNSLQYIKDVNTIQRILPDAPTINNSGTAKTLWNMFSKLGNPITHPLEALSKLKEGAVDLYTHQQNIKALNAVLKGTDDAKALSMKKFADSPSTPVSPEGYATMNNYYNSVLKGQSAITNSIKALFKGGGEVLPQTWAPSTEDKQKLDDAAKQMKLTPNTSMNTGGALGHYLPEQAQALAQSSARISGYLNSIRPSTQPNSPMGKPLPVSKPAEASYQNALSIAQQPLVVLDKLDRGSLTSQDMQHLLATHPDFHALVMPKIMEHLTEDPDSIPYRMRQYLSLFMGQPLDATLQPSSIIAAQPQPQPSQQQQGGPPAGRNKKNTASLGKNNSLYRTPSQAADQDRQRDT